MVKKKKTELEQQKIKTLRGEVVFEEELQLKRELKTLEDAENMVLKQKAKEIKEAFFSKVNDKAPGPDGFSPLFFKKSWPIIAEDTIASIKLFFQDSFLLPGFNATATALALGLPPVFINWIKICFSIESYSISFNGSLIGHFKGARGVRQGDPLSPFLFFLSMNILSRLLNMATSRGTFRYHPKCKRIALTHLSFADDLLIFCKGSVDFVIGVTTVLDLFYEMSGLSLNASKYDLFAAGIPYAELEKIKQITGFKLSRLLVRYLGIPLVTRKISKKDCTSLIDNIKARFHFCSARSLSYAGRLELVRAVLFSIANYWCRQLILPSSVIKKIEHLCPRFFWKGAYKTSAGARVKWQKICLLKSEGSFGIKDLRTWNKACIMILIKNILVVEGSLWVAWLRSYVFNVYDFWNIEIKPSMSWNLRQILKMRPEANSVMLPAMKKVKEIWNVIRVKNPKVSWNKLLWFPLHIPKHNLITWMVFLDRLPTRERLKCMRLINDCQCVFCGAAMETRNHLFFEYHIVVSLWAAIFSLNGLRNHLFSWNDFLAWATAYWKDKSLLIYILKISSNAHIYTLWEERNKRIFQERSRNIEDLIHSIKKIMNSYRPCFYALNVARGLYDSCIFMLNLRCLGIVFDLDETLVVANRMRYFEDQIDVLQRKINTEVDPQRAAVKSSIVSSSK
ncbi:uncharacterized protein LOC120170754 [Hibiscus syriacus]|uniref:uncharacterized protein LOC120170754 n=1 Tax=Hibiscus syriacus TaxID=106335 RepID=UPI0019216CAB|nr:uncharacterized protein LOC120170754 [Hibiscus syriacus]